MSSLNGSNTLIKFLMLFCSVIMLNCYIIKIQEETNESMFCHAPSLLKYTINITPHCNRSDQLPILPVLITARGGLPYKSGIPSMFHVFGVGKEIDSRLRCIYTPVSPALTSRFIPYSRLPYPQPSSSHQNLQPRHPHHQSLQPLPQLPRPHKRHRRALQRANWLSRSRTAHFAGRKSDVLW